MTQIINSYTSWQPLEEVIVGRVYTPEYFDFIEDNQVKGQLTKILEESAEDLDNLQKIIYNELMAIIIIGLLIVIILLSILLFRKK